VDCFHPENVGLVSQGRPRFLPCTPAGIIELLKQSNVPLVARKVAVVNNSDIVGKPLALLLSMEGATVSICHHRSNSTDVKSICRDADIVVVAVGKAHFLDRNYVRAGQTVIDVGVSKVDGKIVGDVHPEVRETVAAVTPCTGGVGPMTVSMLMSNVAEAAYLQV
jgi:methylenetetrahydrofolate dehydrogenase (NADP+)/methenyltetrahydrofolate cyclohydrolase